MSKIDARTFSEVYSYINLMGKEYIEKIPEETYKMIIEMKDNNYNPEYTLKDFNDNNKTNEKTRYIILQFYMEYWCESEEIKKKIIEKLNENEKKLMEQYNPFKNKEQERSKTDKEQKSKQEYGINNNKSLMKYKESIFIKIIKFIKTKFKKNK